MKITAVIVTFNRLDLLKKCLPAVLEQSRPVDEVVVINNSSTDGTGSFLDNYALAHPVVKVTNLDTNIGGAGGFERGIETAIRQGADYVWIMDDDTLPTPTALEKLIQPLETDSSLGFTCSRVEWTDGSFNRMNIPIFRHRHDLYETVDSIDVETPCDGATFVSLLVPRHVILEVGLPIGEFFIWHDDVEFTERIVKAGYRGLYVPSSVVVHATATNAGASIIDAPYGTQHRFYYQIRNQMATKRLHSNAIVAYISQINRLRRFKRAIAKRQDHRDEFLHEVLAGYHDGRRFHPTIKKVN